MAPDKETFNPETVQVLSILRGGKRQSATKTLAKVKSSLPDLTLEECNCLISKLETLKSSLNDLDYKINSLNISSGKWDQDEYAKQLIVDEEYADDINAAIVQLHERVKYLTPIPATSGPHGSSPRFPQHKVTLPNIELPSFDGKPELFNKFINSFENLISKYNLSSFEKFSYLFKQLSGPAKKIVESLSLNNSNYESAKQLLSEAYSNKLDQQFAVIHNLLKLKLDPDTTDAFTWIGDSRLITEQIRSLDITSDIFAQYFLWNGLNDDFKQHLIAISQKSRPSLSEINNAMFEANLRYVEQRKLSIGEFATSVSATSIKSESNSQCGLCSYDESNDKYHKLSRCPRYADANSKIAKLRSINGCTKCGFTNHHHKTCKFKFYKNCFQCGGSHMTYLCLQKTSDHVNRQDSNPTTKSNDKGSKPKSTTNAMSVVAHASRSLNDVILPTATVYMGSEGSDIPVRLFKDIGSQSSFVKGTPDTIPNAVLIKTEQISVKGINSIKHFEASTVKFPIKVPGQGEQIITAICVPELTTEVAAPGLASLSTKLKKLNCVLADKSLNTNYINDISILLGSDNSHVLPVNQFNFSCKDNKASVMYSTPAGVMLAGSVAGYFKNLKALPPELCGKD